MKIGNNIDLYKNYCKYTIIYMNQVDFSVRIIIALNFILLVRTTDDIKNLLIHNENW